MSCTDAEVQEVVRRAVLNLNERITVLERELAEALAERDDLVRALREIGMIATVAIDLRDEPEAEPEPEPEPTPAEAGAASCKAGLSIDANPFPPGHPPHGQWRAGWISEARGGRR